MGEILSRSKVRMGGSNVGHPWQIAAAVIVAVVLAGGFRTAEAQASARLQVAATVVPATAAWESQSGVQALIQAGTAGEAVHTSVATITSEPRLDPRTAVEADPRRIVTVNYLAN